MVSEIKKHFDSMFGDPTALLKSVNEISASLATLDMQKLKEMRAIIVSLGSIQAGVNQEQMQYVTEIIKILCSVDIEKVKEFRALIQNLTHLAKMLPKDVPVKEIMDIVKGEVSK